MRMTFSIIIVAVMGFCLSINAQNKMILNAEQGEHVISKHIYGKGADFCNNSGS